MQRVAELVGADRAQDDEVPTANGHVPERMPDLIDLRDRVRAIDWNINVTPGHLDTTLQGR